MEVKRLIAEGKPREARDAVSKQYRLFAPDMETAKRNVHQLIELAKTIHQPAQNDDGLRWELSNLCHSIENVAGQLYRDAAQRYEKLKSMGSQPATARTEVQAMQEALTVLAFALRTAGRAQNKHDARNYEFWQEHTRDVAVAIAQARFL